MTVLLQVFQGVDVGACKVTSGRGRKTIDVVHLHRMLLDFQAKRRDEAPVLIRAEDGTDVEADEIRLIMTDALRQNQ